MFKTRKFLALLTAACMLTAFSLTSCSSSSSDDDNETASYTGAYTVNGASYTNLTMSGTAASGTATLSGTSGTLNGTYASGASVRALALNGAYTLTFNGTGTIRATFSGSGVSLSAGSTSASGSGSVPVATTPSNSSSNSTSAASGTGDTFYYVEASSNPSGGKSDALVIKAFSNGVYTQLKSKYKDNTLQKDNDLSNSTENLTFTINGNTATCTDTESGTTMTFKKFTGDIYAHTNAEGSANHHCGTAEAIILGANGTGKYIKEVFKDGARVPGDCSEIDITYTTSGSTVTATAGGNPFGSGTLGSDSLTIEGTVYKKL